MNELRIDVGLAKAWQLDVGILKVKLYNVCNQNKCRSVHTVCQSKYRGHNVKLNIFFA